MIVKGLVVLGLAGAAFCFGAFLAREAADEREATMTARVCYMAQRDVK